MCRDRKNYMSEITLQMNLNYTVLCRGIQCLSMFVINLFSLFSHWEWTSRGEPLSRRRISQRSRLKSYHVLAKFVFWERWNLSSVNVWRGMGIAMDEGWRAMVLETIPMKQELFNWNFAALNNLASFPVSDSSDIWWHGNMTFWWHMQALRCDPENVSRLIHTYIFIKKRFSCQKTMVWWFVLLLLTDIATFSLVSPSTDITHWPNQTLIFFGVSCLLIFHKHHLLCAKHVYACFRFIVTLSSQNWRSIQHQEQSGF